MHKPPDLLLDASLCYSIFYLKGLNLGLELSSMYVGIIPFVGLQIIVVVLIILAVSVATSGFGKLKT